MINKIIRTVRSFALVTSLAALTACSETLVSDWTPDSKGRSLGLSDAQIEFDSKKQNKTVNVVAENIPWAFRNQAAWLSFSPASGESSAPVGVAVEANTSEVARVAIALLTSTDSQIPRSYDFTVSQAAPEPYLRLAQSEVVFEGGAGQMRVSVECNRSWSCTASNDWISVDKTEGAITISVTDNDGMEARTGYVNVKADNESLSQQVRVVQREAKVTSTISAIQLGQAAASKAFTIQADASWTAETAFDWIEIDESTRSGKAGTHTIKFRVTENVLDAPRTGFIYIKVGLANKLEVSVTQDCASISASVSELNFTAAADTKEFRITSNTQWNFKTTDDWIHIGPMSGAGNGTIKVRVDENKGSSRVGIIRVLDERQNERASIRVNQDGVDFTVMPLEMRFGKQGGRKSLYLEGEQKWTASTQSSWISLDKSSGDGTDEITVTVDPNTGMNTRTGIITIKDATSGKKLYDVKVEQSPSSLFVTPSSVTFAPEGSLVELDIVAVEEWKIVAPSWITLNRKSGRENATVKASAISNRTGADRTDVIEVQTASGQTLASVAVKQAAIAFSVSPSDFQFKATGSTEPLTISSNVSWTASVSDPTWLKLSATSGKNATINLNATENTAQTARTAEVTFKATNGASLSTLSVTQLGAGISASPAKLSYKVGGGNEVLHVSANSHWTLSSDANWLSFSNKGGYSDADVNIKAEANETDHTRTATISLKNNADKVVQTISVTQEPTTISVSPSLPVEYKPSGESIKLKVSSNYYWTVTAPSWIKLSPSGGYGDVELTTTCEENTTSTSRSGYIDFKNRANGTMVHLLATQDSYGLKVTPASISCGEAGTSVTLSIDATSAWSAKSSATWVTLGKTTGTGKASFVVKVQKNTSDRDRSAEITITSGQARKVIPVTQTYSVQLSAMPESFRCPAEGGSFELQVASNTSWSLQRSSAASWVTFDNAAGKVSGSGSRVIDITVNPNTTTSARSVDLYLYNAAGEIVQTIPLTQEGEVQVSEYEKTLPAFASKGGDLKVDCYENKSWTAKVTDGTGWITVSPASGAGSVTPVITVSDNPSGDTRRGLVEITYGGNHCYKLHVTQSGKSVRVSPTTYSFFAKGGKSESFVITADVNALVKSEVDWLTVTKSGNTFTLTAKANTSDSMREGTVTITLQNVTNSPTKIVTVKQAGTSTGFNFGSFGDDENWTN